MVRLTHQAAHILGLRVAHAAVLIFTTAVIARHWGADDLGAFALLRTSTSVVYMLLCFGIPSALVYYGAQRDVEQVRFFSAVVSSSAALGAIGTAVFFCVALLTRDRWFSGMTTVQLSILSVITFFTFTLQFSCAALRGNGRILASYIGSIAPDLAAVVVLFGLVAQGQSLQLSTFQLLAAVVLLPSALAAAAVLTAVVRFTPIAPQLSWDRELQRGFFSYGMRAYAGGLATFLNFRLDVLILGLTVTQREVGIYGAATGIAEMLRMISVSVAYVVKPRVVGEPLHIARERIAKYTAPLLLLGAAMAACIGVFAPTIIELFFGREFLGGTLLVRIVCIGTSLSIANGLYSSFFDGRGRPELTSYAVFAGLGITLLGAPLLVVPFGSVGAAITSAASYITVALMLMLLYWTKGGDANRVFKVSPLSQSRPSL